MILISYLLAISFPKDCHISLYLMSIRYEFELELEMFY